MTPEPIYKTETTPVALDWSDRSHWSPRLHPCRCCRRLTQMLDDQGQPCHKVCAEAEFQADVDAAARRAGIRAVS